jgi:sugar lactone lactonase YvrE
MFDTTVRLLVMIAAAGCVLGTTPSACESSPFTIYVSDIGASGNNDQVLAYTSGGVSVWNSGTAGQLANPQGIAFGPDGLLYVANQDNNRVARFNPQTGAFVDNFATGINVPSGMVFGPDTTGDGYRDLYVTTWNQNSVVRVGWTPSGPGAPGTFTSGAGGSLNAAAVLAFGPDGNLYVGGFNSGNVVRFNGSTGVFIDVFASGIPNPGGLTFDAAGNLYVSSSSGDKVAKFQGPLGASPGTLIGDFIATAYGGIDNPQGIAFGPDGLFYVANAVPGAGKILRYNATTGAFVDEFLAYGAGGLGRPTFFTFAVPEPGTLTLLGSGALGVLLLAARRRRKP